MSQRKKNIEPDEDPGAPEWMVTFSDCMTLLLTFFVLLLSFSSFDDKKYKKLDASMAENFSAITPRVRREKDALRENDKVKATEEIAKGSETPTKFGTQKQNLASSKNSKDFRNQKVFLIPSEKIFYAKGTVVTPNGKEVLSCLAEFLEKVNDRIVIYEGDNNSKVDINRIWAIIDHLTKKNSIHDNRLNVSLSSSFSQKMTLDGMKDGDSFLEIILLQSNGHN